MADISIRRVRDLDESARAFVEAFLGRKLAAEEQVTVMALPARPGPCGADREAAAARLLETVEGMSERAKGVSEEDLEALIDEAVEDVRRRR